MREMPSYGTGFARYAAESEAPEQWRGLVAAWPIFLGPTGGTVHEPVGKHNGILTNMDPGDWVATVDRWGNPIYALDFDGSNDLLDCGNDSSLNLSSFSVSVCVRPDTLHFGCLVSKGSDDVAQGWYIRLNADGVVTFCTTWIGGDEHHETSNVVYSAGYWVSILVTFDGANVKIFVDGKDEPLTDSTYAGAVTSGFPILIGSNSAGGILWRLNGVVESVRLYNRALSAAEVWQSYIDPYTMWRLTYVPLGKAAVVANDLLLLQQSNLRGNLQDLRGGLR